MTNIFYETPTTNPERGSTLLTPGETRVCHPPHTSYHPPHTMYHPPHTLHHQYITWYTLSPQMLWGLFILNPLRGFIYTLSFMLNSLLGFTYPFLFVLNPLQGITLYISFLYPLPLCSLYLLYQKQCFLPSGKPSVYFAQESVYHDE